MTGPLTERELAQRKIAGAASARARAGRHQAETTPSVQQGSSGAPSRRAVGLFRAGQQRSDTRAARGVWDTRTAEAPAGTVHGTVTFHFPKAYRAAEPAPPSKGRPLLAEALSEHQDKSRRRRQVVRQHRDVTISNPGVIAEAQRHPEMRALVHHAIGVVRDHQKSTIARAEERGLIPAETRASTVRRAYKHAALVALHKAGLVHYDWKMDPTAKREFSPLVPMMRYVHRRIFDHLNQGALKGKWAPFRDEFGQLYVQRKFGKETGHQRMRMAARHEFIKLEVIDGDLEKAWPALQGLLPAAESQLERPIVRTGIAAGGLGLGVAGFQQRQQANQMSQEQIQQRVPQPQQGMTGSPHGLHLAHQAIASRGARVPKPPQGIPKIAGANTHIRDAAVAIERHFGVPRLGRRPRKSISPASNAAAKRDMPGDLAKISFRPLGFIGRKALRYVTDHALHREVNHRAMPILLQQGKRQRPEKWVPRPTKGLAARLARSASHQDLHDEVNRRLFEMRRAGRKTKAVQLKLARSKLRNAGLAKIGIPVGAIRRFHVTDVKNMQNIFRHGISTRHSKSFSVFSWPTRKEADAYASGGDKAVVEFHDKPEHYERHEWASMHSVPRDNIIAVHYKGKEMPIERPPLPSILKKLWKQSFGGVDLGFELGADPYPARLGGPNTNPQRQLNRAIRPRMRRQKLRLRLNTQRDLRRLLSGGITQQERWQLGATSTFPKPAVVVEKRKVGIGRLLTEREVTAAARLARQPTDAQAKSGTYRKGHVSLDGLDVSIENPKGSTRSGFDRNGKRWRVTMPAHYGYVRGTRGYDGDQVDVYLGPHTEDADGRHVYVVEQHHPDTGRFDEHKTFIGFRNQAHAVSVYDAAFSDGRGPERRKAVHTLTWPHFKAWVKSKDKRKELGKLAKGVIADAIQFGARRMPGIMGAARAFGRTSTRTKVLTGAGLGLAAAPAAQALHDHPGARAAIGAAALGGAAAVLSRGRAVRAARADANRIFQSGLKDAMREHARVLGGGTPSPEQRTAARGVYRQMKTAALHRAKQVRAKRIASYRAPKLKIAGAAALGAGLTSAPRRQYQAPPLYQSAGDEGAPA